MPPLQGSQLQPEGKAIHDTLTLAQRVGVSGKLWIQGGLYARDAGGMWGG